MLFIGARSSLPRQFISRITDNLFQMDLQDLEEHMEGCRYWNTQLGPVGCY